MARVSDARGRELVRWELDGVTGPVVVIDVLRAFTTAAYAFASGAEAIYVVEDLEDARDLSRRLPGALTMGEEHGLRPDGFDFSNSPAAMRNADLAGKTLIQRTSAGTRGLVAAAGAERMWAASLVCASATARAVTSADLGAPTYVITGCYPDAPDVTGHDDRATARLIERARLDEDLDAAETSAEVRETLEARRLVELSAVHRERHGQSDDLDLALAVDAFGFAMEVRRDDTGLRMEPVEQPLEIET